jgi:predicted nucleic acid-binding protein
MNVIDSSAWLSFFAGDKNAAEFAKAIEDTRNLLVPSITLTEVFKSVLRQRDQEAALVAIAHMQEGQVIPLDAELALEAASCGVIHKLPLADSIVFATAQKYRATLWTQDSDFNGLPNVRYFSKANPPQ